MAVTLKLLSIFLVTCFARQGSYVAFGAQCGPSQIVVGQSKTGQIVEGKPEYQVRVTNKCSCPQSQVIVNCFGLSSVEPVDPNAIRTLDQQRCIVNNGNPIASGSTIKFKYAWLTPQDFPVVSTHSSCN